MKDMGRGVFCLEIPGDEVVCNLPRREVRKQLAVVHPCRTLEEHGGARCCAFPRRDLSRLLVILLFVILEPVLHFSNLQACQGGIE